MYDNYVDSSSTTCLYIGNTKNQVVEAIYMGNDDSYFLDGYLHEPMITRVFFFWTALCGLLLVPSNMYAMLGYFLDN